MPGYVLRGLLACQVVGSVSLTILQIRNLLQQIFAIGLSRTQVSTFFSVSHNYFITLNYYFGKEYTVRDIFINLKQEKLFIGSVYYLRHCDALNEVGTR